MHKRRPSTLVGVTGSTPTTALLVYGTTLASYFGISDQMDVSDLSVCMSAISEQEGTVDRIKRTGLLIIDAGMWRLHYIIVF
jgi:hypothetical protein